MHKKLIWSAILVFSGGSIVPVRTTFAQTSPVQIGAELGASIASINGDGSEENSSRKAPYGGVSLVIQKPDARFGFQTGLLFVPKGSTSEGIGSTATFGVNYVELPLLLRISFPLRGSGLVPSLLLGGSVAAKVSCKLSGESASSSASVGCDDPTFNGDLDVKTIDAGVSAGVEFAIPVGKRMFLAPRYDIPAASHPFSGHRKRTISRTAPYSLG